MAASNNGPATNVFDRTPPPTMYSRPFVLRRRRAGSTTFARSDRLWMVDL